MADGHMLGTEWLVDVNGCDAALLRNRQLLMTAFKELLDCYQLIVVGEPLCHQFGGEAGITGMFLLSESHLCFHTFPEYGALALSLYSCRNALAPDFELFLRKHLGQVQVRVRCCPRPGGAA